jgi:hypothetical protein
MSSTRRIDASRANGARSRGPVTESGKQISSQNARSHDLLGRCIVVEGESREGFQAVLTQHLERFQPADGVELGIVEEMVAASWRMRRAWAIESRLLSEGIDAQPPCDPTGRLTAAFSSLADSPALALLHRYEIRLHRIYQRGLRNLQLLQTEEIPNEPSPISEHLPAPEPPHEPGPISDPLPPEVVDAPIQPQQPVARPLVAQPLVAQAFSLRCRHSWRHSSVALPFPPSTAARTHSHRLIGYKRSLCANGMAR